MVAAHFQHLTGQLPDEPRILGQQDGFTSMRRNLDASAVFERLSQRKQSRQVYLESRTFAGTARDGDIPAALLDDAIYRRKPQARAARLVFRGEERFEDMRQDFGIHSTACVLYREHGVPPTLDTEAEIWRRTLEFDIACPDSKLAAIGHRVQGIYHEVHQYLFDLSAVRFDRPQVIAQVVG